MKETLSAFWQFLKQPRLLRFSKDGKSASKDLVWLLLLDLLFAGILVSIYLLLEKYHLIRTYETFDLFKYGFVGAMILCCVLAPLIEESMFRYQLRKWKLAICFIMISLAAIMAYFFKNENIKFVIYVAFLVLAITIYATVSSMRKRRLYSLWRKYYGFHFYFTALVFGIIHLGNIKGLTLTDPSFVIYMLSQSFGALTMGYIRLKYGLRYSILLHGLFNAILFPLAWFWR